MASTSPLLLLLSLLAVLSTAAASAAALPPSFRFAEAPFGWGVAPSPELIMPHHIELLAPILASLGYDDLADAAPALSADDLAAFPGPITLFAPSDASVRSCSPPACSPLRLLREHLVPGHYTRSCLAELPFGAKLQTSIPDRCLTVTTSTTGSHADANSSARIFLDGVEIARPDLYDDGRIAIHGLKGFVAPLSPVSCVPGPADPAFLPRGVDPSMLTRLMLRDAILRLHGSGYSILSLAMRVKYKELASLNNMTVFALDDQAIFTGGGYAYVSSVRFHIVPDRLLVHADLMRLPEGTVLPTLVRGQRLVVTRPGPASGGSPATTGRARINYVPVKAPDVIYNGKIAVHGIPMPFPHLYLADRAATTVPDEGELFGAEKDVCRGGGSDGCLAPSESPAASPTVDRFHDGL